MLIISLNFCCVQLKHSCSSLHPKFPQATAVYHNQLQARAGRESGFGPKGGAQTLKVPYYDYYKLLIFHSWLQWSFTSVFTQKSTPATKALLGQCNLEPVFCCFDRQSTNSQPEKNGSRGVPGHCWARKKEQLPSGAESSVPLTKQSRKHLSDKLLEQQQKKPQHAVFLY